MLQSITLATLLLTGMAMPETLQRARSEQSHSVMHALDKLSVKQARSEAGAARAQAKMQTLLSNMAMVNRKTEETNAELQQAQVTHEKVSVVAKRAMRKKQVTKAEFLKDFSQKEWASMKKKTADAINAVQRVEVLKEREATAIQIALKDTQSKRVIRTETAELRAKRKQAEAQAEQLYKEAMDLSESARVLKQMAQRVEPKANMEKAKLSQALADAKETQKVINTATSEIDKLAVVKRQLEGSIEEQKKKIMDSEAVATASLEMMATLEQEQ